MPSLTRFRRFLLAFLFAAAVHAQCSNSIIAGPTSTYSGDGQLAISAFLFNPQSLTQDSAGNVYIADSGNSRIRKVTTDGVIHTVAGPNGLNSPQFVLAAPDGSVYISDSGNHRILKLSASGSLTTFAGAGHPGYSGDNAAAIAAELNYPTGLALDSQGDLYFADTNNGVIRRIDTSGVITTVASPAEGPVAVAIAPDGSLFVAATECPAIYKVAPDGTVSVFNSVGVSTSSLTLLPDGSLLVADGDLLLLSPDGKTLSYYARTESAIAAALGPGGAYYLTSDSVAYHLATRSSEPALFAGQFYTGDAPDNVSAFGPIFGTIGSMAVGPDGTIWVGDAGDSKIRKILPGGVEHVVATNLPTAALVLDPSGNLYAGGAASVWKVASNGSSSLFAGGGSERIPVVGAAPMPASAVDLATVDGLVIDSSGNIYVISSVDGYQSEILITRVTPAGQLTTIFDSTTVPSLAGAYLTPEGFAMDSEGYLLLAAYPGRNILRIAPDGSGIAQTIEAPDNTIALAGSPSGEIFYLTSGGRIKALHAGATLFHRDIVTDLGYGPSLIAGNFASSLINWLLTSPRPGVAILATPSLATDSAGNVYYADPTINAIRRFPTGECFTVRAPQISVDTPTWPITPQPGGVTITNLLTVGTTTTSTTTLLSGTYGSLYAPGELISIYGTGLGPRTGVNAEADSNGVIGTQLGGTQVFLQGIAAPVLYASDGRVNVVVPFSLYGYTQLLTQVSYNGVLSDAITLDMYPAAPSIFTNTINGAPVPIVVNQDGTINSPSNPARPGSVITFYGSGFGVTTPTGTDGHIATVPLPKPTLSVTAIVDNANVEVLYAGDAAGQVEGVIQVNLRLPQYLPFGNVTVTVGNAQMAFGISVGPPMSSR